ncbi:MAG: DUF11 domain-containing protein [Phycisphaeraceae bacterium]|nr:DUF11 domain-containing protein [Phycisphaeraceae bacterium]
MKKQAIIKKKASMKPFLAVLVCCLAATGSLGTAKSLYVAGNSDFAGMDTLWVYDVQPDGKLVFQTTSSFLDGGDLAVNGVDVDPESNTLFMTYTGFSEAGTVNTQSLDFKQFIYLVPWDMHAGGIIYDKARSRVYVTDDKEARLIIYNWVPEVEGLHNIGLDVSDVPLNKTNAGALAYDPDQEMVYVASTGSGVEIVKTASELADWKQMGSIQSAYEVRALSVDARNQILYTGGSTPQGAAITQHNLGTGAERQIIVANTSQVILSLCVDNATSLLYALYGDLTVPQRTVKVYDSAFHTVQTISLAGDALQLHVPSTSVGFNPLNVTMAPVSGTVLNNGQHVAGPGSDIEYEICMTNTNLFPATDVILTDTLPAELEFVRAQDLGDALGVYDELSRTYFYHNPSVEPNSTQCFSIVAKVRRDTAFGTIITNSVSVDSNETPQSGVSVDVEVGHNTLGLTKTVVADPNHLRVGDTIYVDAGAILTYQLCLSNLNNFNAVENVLVIDQLPESVEFVSAEEVGLINHYDASSHSFSWAFDVVEPNYLDCFTITVRIKDGVPPGQLISNEALLGGSGTSTVAIRSDIVVKYNALTANIRIANSSDYNPVTGQVLPGGILTYVIDVNNFDPQSPADEVIVIDSAPEGLQFIGASLAGDSNGVYDPFSRTFTYEQPSLGPLQGIHIELTFVVDDGLPGGTVLTNSVIALSDGAPPSDDSVNVIVNQPGTGSVSTTLQLHYTGPLQRHEEADDIMAVMTLPGHITREDINTALPLMMTPGPSPSFYKDGVEGIPTIYYMYDGVDGTLNVKGFFDRQLVLDALLPGQESVTITVRGLLKTGQNFVGQATVPVN